MRRVELARSVALAMTTLVAIATPAHASSHGAEDTARQFRMELADRGDFVSQATPYWCIGASMQMMLNIVGAADDEGRRGQERYMRVARSLGPSLRQVDHGLPAGGLQGAGSSGWARGLTKLGAGSYGEWTFDRYDDALRAAANALRRTGRPVGLIVWRGAHAWVMTGFTASADPVVDPAFRVTAVTVLDPWYPRISSIWGPGQKPLTRMSTMTLKSDFLPRRGGRWHAEQAGKYVVVIPIASVSPKSRSSRLL